MTSPVGASLSEYDEATQCHIIDLGCFIYNKSLEEQQPTPENPQVVLSVKTAASKKGVITMIYNRQQSIY